MPDEPNKRPVKAILSSIGRLGPVVSEIDFFSSMATLTTFKDNAWRSTAVTTYVPLAETRSAGPSSPGIAGTSKQQKE